jgi:Uri superfamily endonuclease
MLVLDALPERGNYTLIVLLESPSRIMIPSRGWFWLRKGYYVYTGSAVGKGAVSLRQRVARHFEKKKTKRWHIDYLLACRKARITAVVACSSIINKECKITKAIQGIRGATVPIDGFGASDCRQNCKSHLAYFGKDNVYNTIVDAYRRVTGNVKVLRVTAT